MFFGVGLYQVAAEGGENVEEVMVESGAEVDLFEIAPQTPKHKRVASLVADYQAVQDRNITFRVKSREMGVLEVACVDDTV